MILQNKIIFIISQDDWGKLFISKHHYAVALAQRGNKVFFINGPDQKKILAPGAIKMEATEYENVYTVRHRFVFPLFLYFHVSWLFNVLVKWHIQSIVKRVKHKPDIVWSFDLSNTLPLKYFPAYAKKIFMPVDEPRSITAIAAAQSANLILTVTNEILEKYKDFPVSKHFINHAVAPVFFNAQNTIDSQQYSKGKIKIGMAGNFMRPDLDRETILTIINQNPDICFELWGGISALENNLTNSIHEDVATLQFTNQLQQAANVICHGPVSTKLLSEGYQYMDGFLVCYDIHKDQSKGTNYHKLMEFLATGKVIICNNLTTYANRPKLIVMPQNRAHNRDMPALFKQVVENLDYYNSKDMQNERINFARQYLYDVQLEKIQQFLPK